MNERTIQTLQCLMFEVEPHDYAEELEAVRKEQKAATALLRTGEAPEDLLPLRREAEVDAPAATGGAILDFEGSAVFPRLNGAAEGERAGGVFTRRGVGPAGAMASIQKGPSSTVALLQLPALSTARR